MGWIKVSDDWYDDDKMFAAGSIGRDLYWHGMAFCNRKLTDGFIPKGRALSLVDFTDAAVMVGMGGVDGQECAPIAIQRCLEAGLWHEKGHECPTCPQPGPRHYVVHNYLKYQFSKAQIEAKAEANRKRVEAYRESRNSEPAAECSGSNAVGNALHTDVVQPLPTPTPNPSTSSLVTSGGGVTSVDARGPRPHCSRHEENSDTVKCKACEKRRKWDEAQPALAQADELESRRRAKALADNCSVCHGTNWVPDTDPAVRCDHQEEAHA